YNESPKMIKMLVRHGNSFALILDKPVLELLNVDPARPVALSTTDGKSLLVAPLSSAEKRNAKRARQRQRPRRRADKQGSLGSEQYGYCRSARWQQSSRPD